MNIRIAIVLIVGSMIAVSVVDAAVAAAITSTSIATNNFKNCHLIADVNQSDFEILVHCEKEQFNEHWIFGVMMSEIDEGTQVDLCVMLRDASFNYKWNNASHTHENAFECQGIIPTSASAGVAAEEKIVKKNKKYHPLHNSIKHNWEDAAKSCEARSWKLASIETEEENAQVTQLLNDDKCKNNRYWISAYRPVIWEGFKLKYGKKPLSYANWAPGEPNRAFNYRYKQYDRCVQILEKKYNFQWDDFSCNAQNSVLCEERI